MSRLNLVARFQDLKVPMAKLATGIRTPQFLHTGGTPSEPQDTLLSFGEVYLKAVSGDTHKVWEPSRALPVTIKVKMSAAGEEPVVVDMAYTQARGVYLEGSPQYLRAEYTGITWEVLEVQVPEGYKLWK